VPRPGKNDGGERISSPAQLYSKICFDGGVILDVELYPEHIRKQPWFAHAENSGARIRDGPLHAKLEPYGSRNMSPCCDAAR
jgi:hypothetical protein